MAVWLVPEAEKPALAQAYSAYMAEIVPHEDPAKSIRYFDAYWQEPTLRFPYFFGDGAAEGFAFVRVPDEPELDYEMAEFCVLPARRRRGLGASVLPLLFARHPGRWEVSVLQTNAMGLAFWPAALQCTDVLDLRYSDDDIARDYRFTAR